MNRFSTQQNGMTNSFLNLAFIAFWKRALQIYTMSCTDMPTGQMKSCSFYMTCRKCSAEVILSAGCRCGSVTCSCSFIIKGQSAWPLHSFSTSPAVSSLPLPAFSNSCISFKSTRDLFWEQYYFYSNNKK